MNVVSAPVFGAAALLAGPTLWQGLVLGTVPMEHALGRYFVTVVIVWVALSAVTMLIESTSPTRLPATSGAGTSGDEPAGDAPAAG